MQDPRLAQIGVLLALCSWAGFGLELEIDLPVALSGLAAALLTECAGARLRGTRFDPRSPLISGLSLALLLRTHEPLLAACAGALAIGSKQLLRVGGKHVFNPTNFAIVALLLASDAVWVSAGRWGSGPLLAAALVAGALWVLPRARGDVTLAFLGAYAGLLFGRAAWLGDPVAIPLHQLESGALLIFACFMISDPRTVPDSRSGRIAFGLVVAALGFVGRFGAHEPHALLYALAACAPLVPVLDRLRPGRRFAWPGRDPQKETPHVPSPRSEVPLPAPGRPRLRPARTGARL